MLRLAGGPARGWYPRQRHPRPASTENLDRLNPQGSIRAWDTGTGSRKPLTLPPNLTPKFFNKSPREALRRVTSLLIRKGTVYYNRVDRERRRCRFWIGSVSCVIGCDRVCFECAFVLYFFFDNLKISKFENIFKSHRKK